MPIPEKNKQIRQKSISDEVYDQLLYWITDGILQPGEKIVDKDLAEHLGVSRTPVREALRRLEDKKLIESSANRWTRVSPIPDKEPEMIYPVIWTLEDLAISEAADHMTSNDFKKMEAANIQLKKAIDDRDPVASAIADTAFHSVVVSRSKNAHLIRILEDLKLRYRRLEVVFFNGSCQAESSVKEHGQIISALKNNDTPRAREINRLNWEKSLGFTKA